MKIINCEQRSDEWREARLEKITGTRLADAIGTPAKQMSLIHELIAEALTGQPKEVYANQAMQRGAEAEDYAVAEYEQFAGEITEAVGFCISDKYPWLALSPDRLIRRDGKYKKGVEIKAPNTETAVKYIIGGRIPTEYMGQALDYFLVNEDLEELDFAIYDPRIKHDKYRLVVFRLERKDIAQELAAAEAKLIQFHEKWQAYLTGLGLNF